MYLQRYNIHLKERRSLQSELCLVHHHLQGIDFPDHGRAGGYVCPLVLDSMQTCSQEDTPESTLAADGLSGWVVGCLPVCLFVCAVNVQEQISSSPARNKQLYLGFKCPCRRHTGNCVLS